MSHTPTPERPHRALFVGQVALPFNVDYDGRAHGCHQIIDADGFTVCFMANGRPADDDYNLPQKIVRACNAHDALLAACEAVADAEDQCCPRCEGSGRLYADGKAHYYSEHAETRACPVCGGEGRIPFDLESLREACSAAIALAEGDK